MPTESPVFDLHCDAVLKLVHRKCRFTEDSSYSDVNIPKMRKGGVDALFLSLWSDPVFEGKDAVARTQFMLDSALEELRSCQDEMQLCLSSADLRQCQETGKIAAFLGIEGGHSIHNSIKELESFHAQGVRRLTLAHLQSTEWSGSATDDGRNRGLSELGKDIVRRMNELGMVVDVAHGSEKTTLDAAATSSKPIVCTHSLSRAVFDSHRLATDEMISAVAESGGVFGVTFLAPYYPGPDREITKKWMEGVIGLFQEEMPGKSAEEKAQATALKLWELPPPGDVASIEGLFVHLDHVLDLIGEDHVAVGTDFDGIPFGPKGMEDCSKFPHLRKLMREHGYSEIRIRKILGENARRVLGEILP